MSEHASENGETPRGYMPPLEQQITYYRQRCSELTDALTQAQLQIEFQASLIQSLLTAQAVSEAPEHG